MVDSVFFLDLRTSSSENTASLEERFLFAVGWFSTMEPSPSHSDFPVLHLSIACALVFVSVRHLLATFPVSPLRLYKWKEFVNMCDNLPSLPFLFFFCIFFQRDNFNITSRRKWPCDFKMKIWISEQMNEGTNSNFPHIFRASLSHSYCLFLVDRMTQHLFHLFQCGPSSWNCNTPIIS